MIPKEQTERWKQLKRLRWSIILLFFVLFMFNTYPSAKEITSFGQALKFGLEGLGPTRLLLWGRAAAAFASAWLASFSRWRGRQYAPASR
jgi:hypothetical protein